MRKRFLRDSSIVFDGYPIIPATKNKLQLSKLMKLALNLKLISLLQVCSPYLKQFFLVTWSTSKLLSTLLQTVFEKTKSILFVQKKILIYWLLKQLLIHTVVLLLSLERTQICLYCFATTQAQTTTLKTEAGNWKIWFEKLAIENDCFSCSCIFRMS